MLELGKEVFLELKGKISEIQLNDKYTRYIIKDKDGDFIAFVYDKYLIKEVEDARKTT